MGMHSIEDFVEQSVRAVDTAPEIPADRKLSLIHALYSFQDRFDCGFTKLRVFNILLKYHYFFLFDLHEHPDYLQQKEAYDALPNQDSLHVYEDVAAGYNKGKGIPNCYYLKTRYLDDDDYDKTSPLNKLCCQAGSAAWQHFAQSGRLPESCRSFSAIRTAELATEMARLALQQQNPQLLLSWYCYAPLFFDAYKENPAHFEALCDTMLTDASFTLMHTTYAASALRKHHDEDEYGNQRLNTWFAAHTDWATSKGIDLSAPANPLADSLANPQAFTALYKALAPEDQPQTHKLYEDLCNIMINNCGTGRTLDAREALADLTAYWGYRKLFNGGEDAPPAEQAVYLLFEATLHKVLGNADKAAESFRLLCVLVPGRKMEALVTALSGPL